MKNTLVVTALGLALVTGARAASAETISFADLAAPGTGWVGFGSTVLHNGFTFTSNLPIGGPGLSVWKTDDGNHPVGGASTTSLFDYTAGNTTTIARTDGGVFGLNAVDLANWGAVLGNFPATFPVTFVGTRSDQTTVQQTFMVANLPGQPQLQTFSFTGFSNLVSVSVQQGTYMAGTAFQFDNLVVVTGPSVLCDTAVNHPTYVTGDQVQVPMLRFANLTTSPAAVEIKVWLGSPGSTASVLNAGSTGSLVLPAGFDANLGPFPFFTVTAGMPRGGYEFSCRLLDPTTGEVVSVKRTSFVIH